jgi:hypothetical protein
MIILKHFKKLIQLGHASYKSTDKEMPLSWYVKGCLQYLLMITWYW